MPVGGWEGGTEWGYKGAKKTAKVSTIISMRYVINVYPNKFMICKNK